MDEVEQGPNIPEPRPPLTQNFFSPAQSVEETPTRRTRPLSMLSYNPPTLPGTPSPANFPIHSRQPSLSSFRPLVQPTGTPSKRTTRWTLIILPPAILPHSPPPAHVSGFAHGYGASGRYSDGLLLPLQPTLTLQLASIAREFSLPSTGGLTLHLSIPAANDVVQAGPRITDDSWVVLFGWAFDENPSNHSGLQPSTGLPIAARVEFDIDMRKARWFEAWASAAQPNIHRPSLTKPLAKLSTASVPLLRPRVQETPSSTNTGVRALMISASRRPSAKALGSTWLDDGSGTDRQPLVVDHEPHRARSTIAPSEVSPESLSAERESHQLNHPEGQSEHEVRNDRLERLTEEALTDSGQADDASWELQQYQLMKQAALERERIELADLEEEKQEKQRQQVQMLEHERQSAERKREEEKEADRAAAQARLLADEQARNRSDQVVTPAGTDSNQVQAREAIQQPTQAAEQQQPIQNVDLKVNTIAPLARAASGAAAVVISSPQTPPRERRAHTDVGQDPPFSNSCRSEPGQSSSTFSSILGRSVGRFSGEQELLKRRSQTAQTSAGARRLLDEMDKLVQEKALVKEATLLSTARRAVSDDGLLSPVMVKETPKTPPPPPTRSKVIELAKAFAAEERRSAGAGPPMSRQVSRSQERPTGLARSPTNAEQPLGRPFEPAGPISKSLPQTPACAEPLFKTQEIEKVSLTRSPLQKEIEPVVIKETHLPQSAPHIDPTVVTVSDQADVQEASLPEISLRERGSEGEDREEPEWPRSPTYVEKTVEPTYETADTEQAPLSQTSTLAGAFESADDEQPELPPGPVIVEETIEETYEADDKLVADVPETASFVEQKQVVGSDEAEAQSLLAVGQQQHEQALTEPADPKPTNQDPLAPLLYSYDSAASLSEDLAEYIIRAQDEALERHDKFVIAVSGGSLAQSMASGLLGHPNVKWGSWKVFFADERIVPLDSQDSNFGTMMGALFSHVPIERSQMVSIMGLPPDDMDLDEMAPVISTIYEAQVLEELDSSASGGGLPRFDLVLLGMGDDGHTCSLFPSHRLVEEKQAVVSWLNDSPKPPAHRITLSLAILNAAHDAAFVCTGSSKDNMLATVLEHERSSARPASLVKLVHRPVAWFVDEAAAASTTYPRSKYATARSIPDEAPGLADGPDEGRAESLVRNDFGYPHNLSAVYLPVYPNLEGWLYGGMVPVVGLGPSCFSSVGYGGGLEETKGGISSKRETAQAQDVDECLNRKSPCSNDLQHHLASQDDGHSLTDAALKKKADLEQEDRDGTGLDEEADSEDRGMDRRRMSGVESMTTSRALEQGSLPGRMNGGNLEQLSGLAAATDRGSLRGESLGLKASEEPCSELGVGDRWHDAELVNDTVARDGLNSAGGTEACSSPRERQAEEEGLEQVVRSASSYPFNLAVYPAVYPHVEQMIYLGPACNRICLPSLTLERFRPRSQYHESCAVQPRKPNNTTAHVTSDSTDSSATVSSQMSFSGGEGSNGIVYPFNLCRIYAGVYPDLEVNLYPSIVGLNLIWGDDDDHHHQLVTESSSSVVSGVEGEKDDGLVGNSGTKDLVESEEVQDLSQPEEGNGQHQAKHVPARLLTFSGPSTTIGLAYQSPLDGNWTAESSGRASYPHVVQPISPEQVTKLGPMYYRDDAHEEGLANRGIRRFEASIQYSSLDVEEDDNTGRSQSRGPAVGALALEMSKSNLSRAFYGDLDCENEESDEELMIDERKVNDDDDDDQQEVEGLKEIDGQSGVLDSTESERSKVVELCRSPVAILGSKLTDSFYPNEYQGSDGRQQDGVRTYSPSVQYTSVGEQGSGQRMTGGALGLEMQPSGLGVAFYGQDGAGEESLTIEDETRRVKERIDGDEKSLSADEQMKDEKCSQETDQQTGFLSPLVVKDQSPLALKQVGGGSPVGILAATLPESFYHEEDQDHLLIPKPVLRTYSSSSQYSQKTVDDDDDGVEKSPAVGALALHMSASGLSGAFYGQSEDQGSITAEDITIKEPKVDQQEASEAEQKSDSVSAALGSSKEDRSAAIHTRSPVTILAATLADSFYRDEQACLVGNTERVVRAFSPSLQYTQIGDDDEKVGKSPAVEAMALHMSASGLSGAFFGQSEDDVAEDDVARIEGELNQGAEKDHRRSDSSPTNSSKVGSSSQSQFTSHQITDDEWPPTPSSPDHEQCSSELRSGGLSVRSPEDDGRSGVGLDEDEFSKKCGESIDGVIGIREQCSSSSQLIERDEEIGMKTIGEASLVTPMIAQYHQQTSLKEDDDGGGVGRNSDGQDGGGASLTPKANLSGRLDDEDDKGSLSEDLGLDRCRRTGEIKDQVCIAGRLEKEDVLEGFDQSAESLGGLDQEMPTGLVETDMQMAQVSLAEASLITPWIEEFHRPEVKQDVSLEPSSSMETCMDSALFGSQEIGGPVGEMAESTEVLPQGDGRAVNQMRSLVEMNSIDMAHEPISPGRLPSPSLMDRVSFTPGKTVAVLPKQFPEYSGTRAVGNEPVGSESKDEIEVDKHTRQISLSDASQMISPSPLGSLDTDDSGEVESGTAVAQQSVDSEDDEDGSAERLPTGAENQMRSLKEMDSVDMAIEPASPGRLASADLSGRLIDEQPANERPKESQFPDYGSHPDPPPSSRAYIEGDEVMERRMSMAEAGEITPSIAEFHEAAAAASAAAAAAELSPADEPSSPFFLNKDLQQQQQQHQEDTGQFDETDGAGDSTIYAISTDHTEPGPAQRRQLTRTEHGSYSDRLSMIRSSSPSMPGLNLMIKFSESQSGGESTVETEDDVIGGSNVYDETVQTPSEHSSFEPNGEEFDVNRLDELTGQSALTGSSPGSPGPGETAERAWLVEPGQAISAEGLPMIATHPPTPLAIEEELSVPEGVASTMDEELPPPPPPILLPFLDEVEIGEALAQFVFEAQEAAFQRHGKFKVALGGSCLGRILGDGIVADDRIQWQYWDVFLVEEAIAPIGAAESTFSTLMNSILQHVPIPREQVHSIAELTKADIEEACGVTTGMDSLTDSLADEYENTLLEHFPEASHETGQAPRFDLILVGLGDKGQVGSLYASHPLLGEGDWFVAWLGDAPEGPSHRITLTLPVLNAAHQFAFVATGKQVAGIVAEALERSVQSDVPMEEDRVVPAALVKTDRRPIVWFTDAGAASETEYTKSAFWDE